MWVTVNYEQQGRSRESDFKIGNLHYKKINYTVVLYKFMYFSGNQQLYLFKSYLA